MMRITLLLLLLINCSMLAAQKKSIRGYVKDSYSKESLQGAVVTDSSGKYGTVTNAFGYFQLDIADTYQPLLYIYYVGYTKGEYRLDYDGTIILEILLDILPSNIIVDVTDDRNSPEKNSMSVLSIPIDQIKKMPVLFGEADVLRAFQLMPGVQGGKEGTSGLHVRGGSPDQNLFLLDDVPLYNVNHIGGFLSTFDANAIKKVDLYKGSFPARYGGRLSSVMDLRMKDGDMTEHKREFLMGTLASKISLEGPIKKDTSSYFLSVRRFNLDLLTRLFALRESSGETQAGYTFHDIYGKINRVINPKNRIYFSFYTGRDKIFVTTSIKAQKQGEVSTRARAIVGWGNQMASLRWNKLISEKIFSNTTLAFSRYFYSTKVRGLQAEYGSRDFQEVANWKIQSGVTDIMVKQDFDYYFNSNHRFKAGIYSTFHIYNQGTIEQEGMIEGINRKTSDNRLLGLENVIYAEDDIKLNNGWGFNLGAHIANFNVNKRSYISLQPRVLARKLINERSSMTASYSTMQQYVHLLTNNGAGLPADLWVPATDSIPPSNAQLLAIGYSTLLGKKNQYQLTIEAFYKTMNHLIEYKEGVSFYSGNSNINQKVERNGLGKVKGIELLIQKVQGRTTGWIGYTLSKNERQFDNINDNNWFPYRYDRRHDFSIVVNHDASPRITLSGTWTYSSGNYITLAMEQYGAFSQTPASHLPREYQGFPIAQIYGSRNSYQLPSYHKLDIGINFHKKLSRSLRTWNISVYNLYNRQNPFFFFYRKNKQGEMKLNQLSLFTIIPSISYSLRF